MVIVPSIACQLQSMPLSSSYSSSAAFHRRRNTPARRQCWKRRNAVVLLQIGAYLRTLKGLAPSTPLFKGRVPSVKRFDSDLAAAGIPKVEGSRYLDVHALRKTYVTHLRMADVDADFAQRLARHAGTTLTATVYTDEQLLPLRMCVDMLDRADREERRKRRGPQTR